MSEEDRTLTTQFFELSDAHHSEELGSDGEENLRSRLQGQRMTSNETDSKINAIVVPLSTRLAAMIKSVKKLARGVSFPWLERNATPRQPISSGQQSDSVDLPALCNQG